MPAQKNRKHEKTWVMAVDTRNVPTGDHAMAPSPAEIIPFQHPRTNRLAPFLYYGNKFFEIQFLSRPTGDELKDGPSSWFVGDSVVSDGRLGMVTPIDPLFLALPFLQKNGARYSPLDQIFPMATSAAPNTQLLSHQDGMAKQLAHVCDINDKHGPDMIFYRYNETKVMRWLEKKITNVKSLLIQDPSLKSTNVGIAKVFSEFGTNSTSSNSSGNNSSTDAAHTAEWETATSIVSEYLTLELVTKLRQLLVAEGKLHSVAEKIKIASPTKKRVAAQISSSGSSSSGSSSSSSGSSAWTSSTSSSSSTAMTAKEELEALMYGGGSKNTDGNKFAVQQPKKKAKIAMKPVPKGQKSVMSFFSMPKKKKK